MAAGERVLVIGATQGTGYLVAQRLLRDGWAVRVLARDQAKARSRFGDAVEIVAGDITRAESLPPAVRGVDHLILTAGVTRRPAAQALVKATEYEGTRNVLAAARQAGLAGRFMYMGAIGTTRGSVGSLALNLVKGNTLRWRRRAEQEIRGSGLDYTIVHAGILRDAPPGLHPVRIGQREYAMWPWHRIGREDAAEVFVQALPRPETRNTTFDAVWGTGPGPTRWDSAFAGLVPDPPG
jgi:uncharacterized protein YbjT (DUF2867 family)